MKGRPMFYFLLILVVIALLALSLFTQPASSQQAVIYIKVGNIICGPLGQRFEVYSIRERPHDVPGRDRWVMYGNYNGDCTEEETLIPPAPTVVSPLKTPTISFPVQTPTPVPMMPSPGGN